jgi:hypothetical protein
LHPLGGDVRESGLGHQPDDRLAGLLLPGSAHRLPVDVARPRSEHHRDEPSHSIGRLIGVFGRFPLIEQRVPPRGQVFRQRPGLMITAGKVLGVH